MATPMPIIQAFQFNSETLPAPRGVTCFLPTGRGSLEQLPVLFCADGQAVRSFAPTLVQEIEAGTTPPVVLIGVHSSRTLRGREYVPGVDDGCFAAHERFFTDEVYHWACAEFGLNPQRNTCGVFGLSNGGAFALSVGTRHREKYGVIIAFSIAGGADRIKPDDYVRLPAPRYYLSAGTREKPFRDTGRAIAKLLAKRRIEHRQTERTAGHDFAFWNSELPLAIHWSFGEIAEPTRSA